MDDPQPAAKQQLLALVQKINTDQPAPADLAALRALLHANPEIWAEASDLTAKARQLALTHLDPATREAILLRANRIQEDLGLNEKPYLQRLLIEQIGTCWVYLTYTQSLYGIAIKKNADPRTLHWLDRRLYNAQKRYLDAIRALARVQSWW